jgi:hypothetical protein
LRRISTTRSSTVRQLSANSNAVSPLSTLTALPTAITNKWNTTQVNPIKKQIVCLLNRTVPAGGRGRARFESTSSISARTVASTAPNATTNSHLTKQQSPHRRRVRIQQKRHSSRTSQRRCCARHRAAVSRRYADVGDRDELEATTTTLISRNIRWTKLSHSNRRVQRSRRNARDAANDASSCHITTMCVESNISNSTFHQRR